jgi:hypothetical protein
MKRYSVEFPTKTPAEFWTPIEALGITPTAALAFFLGATARGVKGARIVDLKGKQINPEKLKNDVSKKRKAPGKP